MSLFGHLYQYGLRILVFRLYSYNVTLLLRMFHFWPLGDSSVDSFVLFVVYTSLLSGNTRCPRPGTSHFSEKPLNSFSIFFFCGTEDQIQVLCMLVKFFTT